MTLPLRITAEIKRSTQEWLAEIERRHALPATQLKASTQVALLTLDHQSNVAAACLEVLRRSTAKPSASDYRALAEIGWAVQDGRGLHTLTALGKSKADGLARIIAQQLGIHITITTGDAMNGFTVACTCGWKQWHSKHGNAASALNRFAAGHLQQVARGQSGG